jgi:hypothetical protein
MKNFLIRTALDRAHGRQSNPARAVAAAAVAGVATAGITYKLLRS